MMHDAMLRFVRSPFDRFARHPVITGRVIPYGDAFPGEVLGYG